MKIILYMAISINGYIAREDGGEDFLSHDNWETLCEIAKGCDSMVVGRKAYEAVQGWGEEYSYDTVAGVQKVVVSRNSSFVSGESYVIAGSPMDAVSKMEDMGLENMLVTGGANLNSSFMKEGLIDEIIINIEPYVLGGGIPIFSEEEFGYGLELLESKKLAHGIMQLHYKVRR
jgi:dihydrofolate reductase